MTPTHIALLGLIAWTILLVVSLGLFRVGLALSSGRRANSFSPSGDDVGAFGQRLTRAHANCYEVLPALGLILVYAIATNQTATTDGLALGLLGARIVQSLIHIASTSVPMVLLRFTAFGAQLGIAGFWLLQLGGLI
ncbi:MAG: MAPEG family protein [Pseudomonadota bacterium]